MRNRAFMWIALVALWGMAIDISGQPCARDYFTRSASKVPGMPEEQAVRWEQIVTTTGFWRGVLGSDLTIWVTVGRFGALNVVGLQIVDHLYQANEKPYHATEGDKFVLHIQGEKPLSFMVSSVSNETKPGSIGGFYDWVGVLAAFVPDLEMQRLQMIVTTKKIEEIQVFMTGNRTIKRSVNAESAKKMMGKFSCFYEYLDERGISLSPAIPPPGGYAAFLPGRYLRKGSDTDFLELRSDGTCVLLQDGHKGQGYYKLDGNTVIMMSPEVPGRIATARLIGSTLKDDEGISWERQPEKPVSPANGAGH